MPSITFTPSEQKALISVMRKLLSTGACDQEAMLVVKVPKAQIKANAMKELLKECPTIEKYLKK